MKRVGFSGTRNGMERPQFEAFDRLLGRISPLTEFHHGDCVGADDEAASTNVNHRSLCRPEVRDRWLIVCHPPADEKLRAFNPHADFTRPPKIHFARNRDIVDETDILIATPPYDAEITPQTRGGTAYTVNYARKLGKPVAIIGPSGAVSFERWPS